MKSNFLSRFTPRSMNHEALEKIFVQRHQLADHLVELIRESALTPAKHYTLLIGPRGIGKTHLVSLIYHRVRQLEDLRERLLIAWLREEEWGLTSYLDLLLSILRALQQEYQDMQLTEPIELLYSSPETAQRDAEALLLDVIGNCTLPVVGSPQTPLKKGGFEAPPFGRGGLGGISGATTFDRTRERGVRGAPRTLLLLVENLNDVFDGLGEQGQKQFRAFLQQNDCCTIVATSQSLFNGVKLRESPFYGFFGIRRLKDLPLAEAVQLLAHIAQLEGDAELASYLRTPTGRTRIQVVHHLAGGNHRVYVVFSEFISRNSLDELVQPFMQMLDDMTPYYQARMAWLQPQQRKIVEFLSEAKQAVSVEEIGKRCFLELQTAGSLLKDLQEKGYVSCEKIENESFYELREPLMRFCLEVKKQRGEPIRLFVDFLRIWYSPKELQQRLEKLPDKAREREYVLHALRARKEKGEAPLVKAYLKDYEAYFEKFDFVGALELAEELVVNRGDAQDWVKHGRCLDNLKRYEEALASFDKAIELDPNYAEAWAHRGRVLAYIKRYEESLAFLDKAIELDSNNVYAWVVRGASLYQLKRYEDAKSSYEKAIDIYLDPNKDSRAWYFRGWSLNKLKRDEEALASFDKAIELDPNNTWAWSSRGVSLDGLKRYGEALASYDKAIELYPNYALPWGERGWSLNQLKRYQEALASLDKAIELLPHYSSAWVERGMVLDNLKRHEEALASLDKGIGIDPNYAGAWGVRGYVLNNLDRYEEALVSLDKAIELDSNYDWAWVERGRVLDNLKRYEEALVSLDKAIEFDPNDAWAWAIQGRVLNNLKRYEEALVSLNKALELDPNYDWAWSERGDLLNNLKRYEEALASFDKALELEPNYAWTWGSRGDVLNNLNRYEEALASFDKAIELDSNYDWAWVMRGWMLNNLDRYEEVLASFDKAIELDPDNAYTWFSRGWVLDNLGRYEEALASCDKAIELGKESSNVFFNRAIAILGLNRWDEGIAALDDAFQRLEPQKEAYTDDAELILRHQFDSTRDVATWYLRLPILLALYHKHQAAPILGQGLVQTIPMLMSEKVSDEAARSWLEVWQNLAGDRPSFQIPLRLLKTAVQYKEKKGDRRVLLQLPIEERKLIQPLLEKAISENVKPL